MRCRVVSEETKKQGECIMQRREKMKKREGSQRSRTKETESEAGGGSERRGSKERE